MPGLQNQPVGASPNSKEAKSDNTSSEASSSSSLKSKPLAVAKLSTDNIVNSLLDLHVHLPEKSILILPLGDFCRLIENNTPSLSEAQKNDLFTLQKYVYCIASKQAPSAGLEEEFQNLLDKQNSCSCKKILAYALKFLIIASITASIIGLTILAIEYFVPEFLDLLAKIFPSCQESLYNAASVVKDFGLHVINEIGLENLIATTVGAAAIGFFSKIGLNALKAGTAPMETAVKAALEVQSIAPPPTQGSI